MKMRKLLSIGALTLTLTTCTSMSAFAAEAVGNRNEAAKSIAFNAWKEKNIINNIDINAKTAVNKYAKQTLIDKVKVCVEGAIEDTELAKEVNNTIQTKYDNGAGAKDIFEALMDINAEKDITNDDTFKAAKTSLEDMLAEFVAANEKGTLDSTIKQYFNVSKYGTLEYGRNSNNRRVVTLKRGSSILLQVSSENVYNLQHELENRIHSWADLKDYFGKIQ